MFSTKIIYLCIHYIVKTKVYSTSLYSLLIYESLKLHVCWNIWRISSSAVIVVQYIDTFKDLKFWTLRFGLTNVYLSSLEVKSMSSSIVCASHLTVMPELQDILAEFDILLSFFHFTRRFWNQIFTCFSVNSNMAAI